MSYPKLRSRLEREQPIARHAIEMLDDLSSKGIVKVVPDDTINLLKAWDAGDERTILRTLYMRIETIRDYIQKKHKRHIH